MPKLTPLQQDFVTALEGGEPVTYSELMVRMYGAPGRNRHHGILKVVAHHVRRKGVLIGNKPGVYWMETRA